MEPTDELKDSTARLDQLAQQYLAPDVTFSVDARLMKILAERLIPRLRGPRILEMGVGADAWTSGLLARFNGSTVVDGSLSLLTQAKQRYGQRLMTVHALFEDFHPTHPFDTVIAAMVLEHVVDPIQVLRQVKQWLSPGGQVLIVVPNADSLHRQYGVSLGLLPQTAALSEADRRIGHRRVYNQRHLEEDIATAGLHIVQPLPTFIKLLSNAQMESFDEQQLQGLFELAARLPLGLGASLCYDCISFP
jgi:2-polyprenyl-3-methyl-5-hydroxy-6-metoxy-1,4-benzoquinol methylase